MISQQHKDYDCIEDISSSPISNMQQRTQGFIGYRRERYNRINNTPRYFFRYEIAEHFEKTYHDANNYVPLKDLFLKILNNYNSNN